MVDRYNFYVLHGTGVRKCVPYKEPSGEFVKHGKFQSLKTHLSAIVAALGVPDAEPGELAGMVKCMNSAKTDLLKTNGALLREAEESNREYLKLQDKCDGYKMQFHECVANSYNKMFALTKERNELREELLELKQNMKRGE